MKKILSILIIAILLFSGCGYTEKEESFSESLGESNCVENDESDNIYGKESFDKKTDEEQKSSLNNVLTLSIENVTKIEIQYRNPIEIKSAIFEGEVAKKLAAELLSVEIEDFDRKKFNPTTGGDRKYIITITDGTEINIVDNGSITINDEEKYLLINANYELSIPEDVVWTIKAP